MAKEILRVENLVTEFWGEDHPTKAVDGVSFHVNEGEIDVYKRQGPAIVVELTSTTIVPPGWRLTVDEADSMIMKRMNGGAAND